MEILKTAIAGTLESSDAQVTVEPGEQGIELTIESSVMNKYGRQIKAAVLETLDTLGVSKGVVKVVDKGALECTLKAGCSARYTEAAAQQKKIFHGEVWQNDSTSKTTEKPAAQDHDVHERTETGID